MEKFEAYKVITGFIQDCVKWNDGEKTYIHVAFETAQNALKNELNITFTEEEIDTLCHAVIASVAEMPRELQDRLYKLLMTHRYEDAL